MERAIVHFATPLPADSKACLQVGFQGKLTSSMQGYYKSSWEHEGQKQHYALTQFEVSIVHCMVQIV
jgi:aminopeptidase 2